MSPTEAEVAAACDRLLTVRVLPGKRRAVVDGYDAVLASFGYDVRDVLTDEVALAVGERVHAHRHEMSAHANEQFHRGEL